MSNETPRQLARCPACGGVDEWPDPWEVCGMSVPLGEDVPGGVGDELEEEDDDGRVFCPNCDDNVVPTIYSRDASTQTVQQELFK